MGTLVVVTTTDLAPGFRLAGARTVTADDPAEAAAQIERLVDIDRERGVIAVHEPLLERLDPPLRRRLARLSTPLVIALPAGSPGGSGRADRLAQLLARAVGYELTFDEPGAPS